MKTSEEVAKEGHILREMLEIVERRDSLHTLLEEDRKRCGYIRPHPFVSKSFVFDSDYLFILIALISWIICHFLLLYSS